MPGPSINLGPLFSYMQGRESQEMQGKSFALQEKLTNAQIARIEDERARQAADDAALRRLNELIVRNSQQPSPLPLAQVMSNSDFGAFEDITQPYNSGDYSALLRSANTNLPLMTEAQRSSLNFNTLSRPGAQDFNTGIFEAIQNNAAATTLNQGQDKIFPFPVQQGAFGTGPSLTERVKPILYNGVPIGEDRETVRNPGRIANPLTDVEIERKRAESSMDQELGPLINPSEGFPQPQSFYAQGPQSPVTQAQPQRAPIRPFSIDEDPSGIKSLIKRIMDSLNRTPASGPFGPVSPNPLGQNYPFPRTGY